MPTHLSLTPIMSAAMTRDLIRPQASFPVFGILAKVSLSCLLDLARAELLRSGAAAASPVLPVIAV